MKIDKQTIINTLDKLGIRRKQNSNSRDWLAVVCPLHADKDFGNASINMESGILNCLRCGDAKNLVGLVMKINNCNSKGAYKFIGLHEDYDYHRNLKQRNTQSCSVNKESQLDSKKISDLWHLTDFVCDKYSYTKERGYTKEFTNEFGIKKCYDGWYQDYIIIPVTDTEQEIETFEARKLCEYDVLIDWYDEEIGNLVNDFKILRTILKDYCDEKKIVYHREGYITENGIKIENRKLLYLLKPKVLYPKNSQLHRTIWNIDNLDFNEDLYICEGISGIPKIWHNLSKNVTSVFGVNITDEQIKLLTKFKKRKIVIVDNDSASDGMVWHLVNMLNSVFVLPVTLDDTDNFYVDEINTLIPIEGTRFLLRRSGLLNSIKVTGESK